jgi:hypothetical protein
MIPVELGTKNHCAGEGKQQFIREAISQCWESSESAVSR